MCFNTLCAKISGHGGKVYFVDEPEVIEGRLREDLLKLKAAELLMRINGCSVLYSMILNYVQLNMCFVPLPNVFTPTYHLCAKSYLYG